ncbi:hypothetical protein BHF71_02325 [Vulcanibacillus modesticaldus]|uniref:Fatty acid-binding protein DegV n=1 Tax=Vulcanibacillus modesticaldus TaxID=337097 RepID=A0A1D2YTW5_9BACI|nr:hypothetical protein BHF71_02325 [Vulcanibacillus modesticaldus]
MTFVLDSGSDYESFLSTFFNYPVRVVSLHIIIDGKEYLDGVDITKQKFYQEMGKAKNLPKTSQPSPQQFLDVFNEELEKGNQVLFIGLSSKLSGTYQSALIAKNMLSEEEQKNVFLVDSQNVSAPIILQLMKANYLLEKGYSLEEVVEQLETFRLKTNFLALLDTLENLKKGGRISTTKATIGEILNIKPLVTVKDGLIKSLESFRGRKKGIRKIKELLHDKKNLIDKSILFIVHNYEDRALLEADIEQIDLSHFKERIYLKIGSTIGTYAGINTIAFAYIEE